jgi:hypothetical protein
MPGGATQFSNLRASANELLPLACTLEDCVMRTNVLTQFQPAGYKITQKLWAGDCALY